MAAGLLRLGFLASFISEPVLKGFIIGLALTIIAGQLRRGVAGQDQPSPPQAAAGAGAARLRPERAPLLFVNGKRARGDIRAELRDPGGPVRVGLLDLSFTPGRDRLYRGGDEAIADASA